MQAVSASIISLLSFAAQSLGYLARILSQGEILTSLSLSLYLSPIRSLALLFLTVFLPPFLSHFVHQVM